jgi:hypothetical protein
MAIKVFDGSSSTAYSPPSQTDNSGKFLTTDGTTTSWGTTGMTLLGSVSASGSLVTFSNIDQSYRDLKIVGQGVRVNSAEVCQLRANGNAGSSYYPSNYAVGGTTTWTFAQSTYGGYFMYYGNSNVSVNINIYNYTADSTTGAKNWDSISGSRSSGSYLFYSYGVFNSTSTAQDGIGPITSLQFYASNSWSQGIFYLYGVK